MEVGGSGRSRGESLGITISDLRVIRQFKGDKPVEMRRKWHLVLGEV